MNEIEVSAADLARARAARIRAGIGVYLSTLADISTAYAQRDWVALGYESWDAYVDGEYSEHRLKLSPEHRQKAVAELRLAGMSQRAIGSALGVSQSTVRDDIAGLSTSTQLPERVASLDGRDRPAVRPITDHPSRTGEADARLDAAGATAVCEAPTGVAAPVGAGETAAGNGQIPPADGAEIQGERGAGSPVTLPVVHAAPAPAVPDSQTGTAGVTPHDPDRFAAVLDRLVPDGNPNRAWQREFLGSIGGAYRSISRSTAQEVAERADEECVAELERVAAELTAFAQRVRRIRDANRPSNVLTLVRRA